MAVATCARLLSLGVCFRPNGRMGGTRRSKLQGLTAGLADTIEVVTIYKAIVIIIYIIATVALDYR